MPLHQPGQTPLCLVRLGLGNQTSEPQSVVGPDPAGVFGTWVLHAEASEPFSFQNMESRGGGREDGGQ